MRMRAHPPPPSPPPVMLHPRMYIDTSVRVRSPGAVLRDDYMLPNAMSANVLTLLTGIPSGHLRRMFVGAPLYAEEALQLADALHTSALYWLVLQARYDLERVLRSKTLGVTGVEQEG